MSFLDLWLISGVITFIYLVAYWLFHAKPFSGENTGFKWQLLVLLMVLSFAAPPLVWVYCWLMHKFKNDKTVDFLSGCK